MSDAANRIDAQVTKLMKPGLQASDVIARGIRAKALSQFSGGNKIDVDLDPLVETLVGGLLVAHLSGEVMARNLAGLSLSVYDATIKAMARKSKMDLTKLNKKYNTRVFKVVNDASATVNKRLNAVVDELIARGSTIRDAKDTLGKAFDGVGLSGTRPSLLETIYRTQMQLAYGAGRWQADQDPDIQEILWGYKYVTVGDDRVRPDHAALDGTTLPKEDDLWKHIWPPNGWNCRCVAIPLFEERKSVQPRKGGGPDEGFDFNAGMALSFDKSQHPRDANGRFSRRSY